MAQNGDKGISVPRSAVRPSMSVNPENTKNLRSKFEQLQVVANNGNSTRNRRGYTATTGPEGSSTRQRGSTIGAPPTSFSQRASIDNAPSSPGPNSPSMSGNAPASKITSSPKPYSPSPSSTNSQGGTLRGNITKTPSNQPVNSFVPQGNANGASKPFIPALKKPVVTEDLLVKLELEDSAQRMKPKQKPKPDLTRQTLLFTKPPLEEPKVEPKVIEQPPEPKPKMEEVELRKPSPSLSGNSAFDGILEQIGEKWKIKYAELEFDELVSAGSAGEVYMGYYFGTPVAIKKLFTLPPDQKHLVAREFSMLQGVNHPNIVQFMGICDHESGIYLITEYVEHGDLFDLLIFGGQPLGWKVKTKIALQVAQAVYYLHSRKIIHRDLKSQNVLIGENMKVKLCDLGLATVMEAAKRMTVCGTNEWMAPEILLQDNYDDKVDVFSFGIVLTELVTCQPPKKRDIGSMLKFDADGFTRELPQGCPPEFAQLVIDCCKFKPEDRPGFKDIVARLRKLQNELPDDDE